MVKMTDILHRTWSELPLEYLSQEDHDACQELFVWPAPPGDPSRRVLACVKHSSGLYVTVRDGKGRLTQLWAVHER